MYIQSSSVLLVQWRMQLNMCEDGGMFMRQMIIGLLYFCQLFDAYIICLIQWQVMVIVYLNLLIFVSTMKD